MKKKINLSNIFAFVTGYYRYAFFYSHPYLLRRHIYEQIRWRITVMDKECYDNGQCKICGCNTTALQMANKSCPKPCYPEMMNKKDWENFKNNNYVLEKKHN